MSKSSEQFLEQREIEAIKELDSFQRFQLSTYGNILREIKRHPVLKEMSEQEPEGRDTDFQNAIFSQLNPAQ